MRCERAETTRDCPFSHRWIDGRAYMGRGHAAPESGGAGMTEQWEADREEMEAGGVGGVMVAMAAVLIDRDHDRRTVIDGMIENAGRIEGELWDDVFGPAADRVAEALGLEPYPDEDEEVQR